jgi:hypothetical protein
MRFCPWTRRVERRPFHTEAVQQTQDCTSHPAQKSETTRICNHPSPQFECKAFAPGPLGSFDGVPPILQQMMMEIDLDRTNFRAGTAQRGSV